VEFKFFEESAVIESRKARRTCKTILLKFWIQTRDIEVRKLKVCPLFCQISIMIRKEILENARWNTRGGKCHISNLRRS